MAPGGACETESGEFMRHYYEKDSFDVVITKETKLKKDWYMYDLKTNDGKIYKFSIDIDLDRPMISKRLTVNSNTKLTAIIYVDDDYGDEYMVLKHNDDRISSGRFLYPLEDVPLKPWEAHEHLRPKQFSPELLEMPYLNMYKEYQKQNKHNKANEQQSSN